MPAVASDGRGGLLDAIVDSDFADNHSLYFCFSELAVSGNANSTALARCTLGADNTLGDVKVIFSQKPKTVSTAHVGCRIVKSRNSGINGKPDGKLFWTLGERFICKEDAQTLDNSNGKLIRLLPQ